MVWILSWSATFLSVFQFAKPMKEWWNGWQKQGYSVSLALPLKTKHRKEMSQFWSQPTKSFTWYVAERGCVLGGLYRCPWGEEREREPSKLLLFGSGGRGRGAPHRASVHKQFVCVCVSVSVCVCARSSVGGGFRPIIKEFSPLPSLQPVAHPDTFMPFYFQAHCSQARRCDLYWLAAWALQQERQMEGGSWGGGGGGEGSGREEGYRELLRERGDRGDVTVCAWGVVCY